MDLPSMLHMWTDMANEGNWIPSWRDSLAGLTAEQAAWSPGPGAHSIWREVVHVTFWRRATLTLMRGGAAPTSHEVETGEFALPTTLDDAAWSAAIGDLDRTHREIAAALLEDGVDASRVPYHLIHDAYHLGRITQVRAMQGTPPTF